MFRVEEVRSGEFLEAVLEDVVGHLQEPALLKDGCEDPGSGGHAQQTGRRSSQTSPVMKKEGDLVVL